MRAKSAYWFRAKRSGWGWGAPIAWQGWIALATFVLALVVAAILFPPPKALAAYLVCVAVSCLLLLGVCWFKGEPPHWRWNGKRRL